MPHETRGRNYLKDEYTERVKANGACYLMEIQVREAVDNEDPEIFNNMVAWDESEYPWHPLAEITIDRVLD